MPLYNYLDIARGALAPSGGEGPPGDHPPDGRPPAGDPLPQDLRDYLVDLAQALQPYGISLSEPHNWSVVLAVTLFYRRIQGRRAARAKTGRVPTC